MGTMEGVGQEGWENIENKYKCGRMEGCNKGKNQMEKRKKTVRKPQLKMHNYTQKMHAKNTKIWEMAGGH